MNKLNHILTIFLITLFLTSCSRTMSKVEYVESIKAIEWTRWTEPGNFYSIEVPKNWRFKKLVFKGTKECPATTVYSFYGPNKIDEITISATYDLIYMPKETPKFLLTEAFRLGETPVSEITRVYGDVWDGWHQNYESGGKFWYAIVARNKETAVLLTIMGKKNHQHLLHETYIKILKSLKVGEGVNVPTEGTDFD